MYVINSERTLISLKEAPVKFFFLFSIPIKAFFFYFVGGGGGSLMCLCLCGEIKLWIQRTVILSAKYSMRATLHFYYGLMPTIFSLSFSLPFILADEVLKGGLARKWGDVCFDLGRRLMFSMHVGVCKGAARKKINKGINKNQSKPPQRSGSSAKYSWKEKKILEKVRCFLLK